MSFKPDMSPVSIYNEALALLPEDPVQDVDEASLGARECSRAYKSVVSLLLEGFHWGLARKRVALAETSNDRANEWRHCYVSPADLAYPVALMSSNGFFATGWYRSGSGWNFPGQRHFEIFGQRIYTNIDGAVLEFTSFDITEADFTVQFKTAVVLGLAAAVAMPITKDRVLAQTLKAEGNSFRLTAIANDANRNNPTYGDKPTESEIVRGAGINPDQWGGGYAIDPVALRAETGL